MLTFGRNQRNSVKQLSSNEKFLKEPVEEKHWIPRRQVEMLALGKRGDNSSISTEMKQETKSSQGL